MSRIFDNYIMVDWSASSKPNSGSDSIWIGILRRDVRLQLRFEFFNPNTRQEAFDIICSQLQSFNNRGDKTLLGFDFALSYPMNFAKSLNLGGAQWRAIMDFLSKEIIDKPNNDNNRFQVASKMNRLLSNGPMPFWGCPAKFVSTFLAPKKGEISNIEFEEMRLCDKVAKAASSVFKLYTPGSVGSQSLTGIPYVAKIRNQFSKAQIWPFETGIKPIAREDDDNFDLIIAEIYPSMLKTKPQNGETKDLAQVRAIAEHFAKLDDDGKLRSIFATNQKLDENQIEQIHQEGWILGF
jgi:hypothetical protein